MVKHPSTIQAFPNARKKRNTLPPLPQHILHYLCAPPTCLRPLMRALGLYLPKTHRSPKCPKRAALHRTAATHLHRMVVKASYQREVNLRGMTYHAYKSLGIQTAHNDVGYILRTHNFKRLPQDLRRITIFKPTRSHENPDICHDCGKRNSSQKIDKCLDCKACLDCALKSPCPAHPELLDNIPLSLRTQIQEDKRLGRPERYIKYKKASQATV